MPGGGLEAAAEGGDARQRREVCLRRHGDQLPGDQHHVGGREADAGQDGGDGKDESAAHEEGTKRGDRRVQLHEQLHLQLREKGRAAPKVLAPRRVGRGRPAAGRAQGVRQDQEGDQQQASRVLRQGQPEASPLRGLRPRRPQRARVRDGGSAASGEAGRRQGASGLPEQGPRHERVVLPSRARRMASDRMGHGEADAPAQAPRVRDPLRP